MSQHRVYALASGKGGVGKTTSAVNLGAALVDAGHTVAVVDVDLGMANVGDVLELDVDGPSLHEVLAGEASVEEATYHVGRFGVVPGGTTLDAYADADPERLGPAIESLRESFDYVLLDVGAGLSHDTVLPLGLADAVLLVATPDRPAIENARKVADVTNRLGGTVDGVLITRADDESDVAERVEEELDVPLRAIVLEDPAVARSAEAGVPVVVTDPDGPAARAYVALAATLDGSAADDGPATAADAPSSESPDTESPEDVDPVAETDVETDTAIAETDVVTEAAGPASDAPDPLSEPDPTASVDDDSTDETEDPLAPPTADADPEEPIDAESVAGAPTESSGTETSDDAGTTEQESDEATEQQASDEVAEQESDDAAPATTAPDDSVDAEDGDADGADQEAVADSGDDADDESDDESGVTIGATPIDLEGAMEGISLGESDEDVDALLDETVADVEGQQDETTGDDGDDDADDDGEGDSPTETAGATDSDDADEPDDPPKKKGFFRRLFG